MVEGNDLSGPQAESLLQPCRGALSEVVIEFEQAGHRELTINGIDAKFDGRSARIFTDRTFNEVYVDGGRFYEVRTRPPDNFDSTDTSNAELNGRVKSLKVYRLKSIWPQPSPTEAP